MAKVKVTITGYYHYDSEEYEDADSMLEEMKDVLHDKVLESPGDYGLRDVEVKTE